MAAIVGLFTLLLLHLLFTLVCSHCIARPPVIFNFGDSNSDTGGLVAGLGFPVLLPNGRSFFRRSTGRLSDGRLLIDFLCKWAPLFRNFFKESLLIITWRWIWGFIVFDEMGFEIWSLLWYCCNLWEFWGWLLLKFEICVGPIMFTTWQLSGVPILCG